MSLDTDNARVKGFLHADGMRVVNGDGEQIVMNGYGAGNWMNPEGFMIGAPQRPLQVLFQGTPQRWDRRRTVSQVIYELCGSEYLKGFWKRWEENHLGEDDIKAMREVGFNTVRLILNANALLYEEPGIHFNEEEFERLTKVLDWCEKYSVYAVLDMHAAPGGACGCCGDSLSNDFAQLFYDDESWERAIILWEEIARRYGERWIVAGYDLLNEPASLPEEWCAIPLLSKFYDECIARIRKIDKKHMIILEGSNFARGNQIFDHDFDPEGHNWCMEVHIYGASPEVRELYPYFVKCHEYQIPMWLGECGSTPVNNAVFFDICQNYGIGYSLWCWKTAMEVPGETNCVGYYLPKDWEIIRSYCKGGAKPSYERAVKIFDEMLENMKYKNCVHNKTHARVTKKQPDITLPGAGYDSFNTDGSRYQGKWEFGNYLNFRMEDKTKLVWDKPNAEIPFPEFRVYECEQPIAEPLESLILELGTGEYANYTVYHVMRECYLTIHYLASQKGKMKIYENEKLIGCCVLENPGTDEKTVSMTIEPGEEVTIKLNVDDGVVQIRALEFKYD